MSRANEFINLFNQVSEYLYKITNKEKSEPFSYVVGEASISNPAVRRVATMLKDYGDLRNAIVHYRTYPHEIIAEPTGTVLSKFRRIVDSILSPPKLIPKFQRELRCFLPEEMLLEGLKYMGNNDYSQIVVVDHGKLSLLTVEGITRWLEQQAVEDIISVSEASIGNATAYEIPDSYVIMSRDRTVYDAQESFAKSIEHNQPRLFAIIITSTGIATEKPLGIVTPWDLLESQ